MDSPLKNLCMVSRLEGFAGPAAFQRRLEAGLAARGVRTSFNLEAGCDAVLIIGGTRRLNELRRIQRSGIPIYQRLNGMNWIHRRVPTGLRHFLRAEMANLLLRTIRSRFAAGVIYQSEFARDWWERVHGKTPVPCRAIHNAVPLNEYTPVGKDTLAEKNTSAVEYTRPQELQRILVVEGNLAGGYETGIQTAFRLADALQSQHGLPVELQIAGRVPDSLKARLDPGITAPVKWLGPVPPHEIPALDRSAHMLYSSDINPACPNSVIEALACGLPVVAFDTGALPELVQGDAGRLAAYGGDPWKLERPDLPALVSAALEILRNQDRFRAGARRRAVDAFSLDRMIDSYLDFLSV